MFLNRAPTLTPQSCTGSFGSPPIRFSIGAPGEICTIRSRNISFVEKHRFDSFHAGFVTAFVMSNFERQPQTSDHVRLNNRVDSSDIFLTKIAPSTEKRETKEIERVEVVTCITWEKRKRITRKSSLSVFVVSQALMLALLW